MSNNCGVCNEEIPLDHACSNRVESDGSVTSYHLSCNAENIQPCSDCGYHRKFCSECAE